MNDDLISRSALKRMIKTECNPYGNPTIDFESGKKVLKIIDNAPTVEPKSEVFEWCTDCKEYDHKHNRCPRFNKVIRNTVEEMKEEFSKKDFLDLDEAKKLGATCLARRNENGQLEAIINLDILSEGGSEG